MRYQSSGRKRALRSGFTMVEVLVAGLIVATSVVGLMQFVFIDYGMTTKSTNMSAAISAGRSAIEATRLLGFDNAPEGNSTAYYDNLGSYPPSTTQTASSIYSVVTNVTSDVMNGSVPAETALRTVRVTVTLISTGQVVYTTYTSLADGGI